MSVESGKTRFADILSICSGTSTGLDNDPSWKGNIRSKIENDLSYQVQEALAPIVTSQKKWASKKKAERRKALKLQVNYMQQRRPLTQLAPEPGDRFKYIDVNYIPQQDQLYSGGRSAFPASLANLRLLKTGGRNRGYGRNEGDRNLCGGLDLTLLDNSSSNLFSISRRGFPGSTLKPLMPRIGEYNGITMPSYGMNRQCFQVYTKDGMNNLLNSKSRRSKLTQMGNGKYVNKHGITLSRVGPFWPSGFGPVCQCPEFLVCCPKNELYGEAFVKPKLPDVRALEEILPSPRSDATPRSINKQPSTKPMWHGKPVVYDSERSSRSPPPHSVPYGMPESLVFESRFESGNLRQVRRIGENEYELVLKTDMYTNRHTQWYYFKIQQAKPNCVYKFSIINFLKKDSLYNYGMKPLIYSEHLAMEKGIGWYRAGHNISYTSLNNPRNTILSLDLQYYCLRFEMSFEWEECEQDSIYVAHCYPYTYSNLIKDIDAIMSCPTTSRYVKREVLCETHAGNSCFLLTVTDFPDKEKDKYKDLHQGKQGVVLSARVHPGESQASWMMKGVIDYLTSDHSGAHELRKKFVFKIVPMLNPDGVIVGNYRTSLAGRDLNRNYRHPKKSYFPTIWHTKEMVDQFNKDHPILIYCDLHGHSRKHHVFMYGCERKALKPKQTEATDNTLDTKPPPAKKNEDYKDAIDFVEERLFPWIMYKALPNRFSFHDTKYAVRRSKEATGRVVMFKQIGIANSFTLEATFAGTTCGNKVGRHFNIADFQLVGRSLCESILEYSNTFDNPVKKSKTILQMTTEIMRKQRLSKPVKTSNEINPTLSPRDHHPSNKVQTSHTTSNAQAAKTLPQQYPESATSSHNDGNMQTNIQSKRETNIPSINGSNKTEISDINEDIDNTVGTEPQCHRKPNVSTALSEYARTTNEVYIENGAIDEDAALPEYDGYLEMIKNFKLSDLSSESETSSDSDSESEPEVPYESPAKKKVNTDQFASNSKKKKKKKVKNGKSVSAPITSQKAKYKAPEHISAKECLKQKPRFPVFVSKYSNRSNGGIPIFAQERIKERAARRLAELNVAKEDKLQQQEQLAEQWASIHNFPRVASTVCDKDSVMCNVRYTVNTQPKRLHYMLCNPYSNPPPTTTNKINTRPNHQDALKQSNNIEDDDCAFHTLSMGCSPNDTDGSVGLGNSGSSSDKSLRGSTISSHSSRSSLNFTRDHPHDDIAQSDEKFLPRTVVLPMHNLSFKLFKKHGVHKTPAFLPPKLPPSDSEKEEKEVHPCRISDLTLPPNMNAGDIMTVHMHYPSQLHQLDSKQSYRFKMSPRGPPMVFGEPVVMNQKANEGYFPNSSNKHEQ